MLDDDELQRIYQWVDEVPLSRPKRNIARDFADGVLMAEIVAHYFPKLVEMHNYPPANSYAQKIYNWNTLNAKVFKKMGFQLRQEEMDALCNCQPQAVEKTLKQLQQRMAKYGARKAEQQLQSGNGSTPPSHAAPPHSAGAHSAVRAAHRSAAVGVGVGGGGGVGVGGGGGGGGGGGMVPRGLGGVEARMGGMGLHDTGVQELLAEKDHNIRELRETVDILEMKIQKLEQLVRLKDSKIVTLQAKLQQLEGH